MVGDSFNVQNYTQHERCKLSNTNFVLYICQFQSFFVAVVVVVPLDSEILFIRAQRKFSTTQKMSIVIIL